MDVVRREVSRSKRVVDLGLEGGGITGWDWRGGLHSGVNSLCPLGGRNPSCFLLDGASRKENETTSLPILFFLIIDVIGVICGFLQRNL